MSTGVILAPSTHCRARLSGAAVTTVSTKRSHLAVLGDRQLLCLKQDTAAGTASSPMVARS
jgi:hypothetical protein